MKHIWGGEKILPNVSLIEETNKVEYNPYIPPRKDIIIYTASRKLVETTDPNTDGLHTNAFNTTIKSHTFENGVGTIEFNDNVTTIGSRAFYECTNLTSITIPNSVTSIGDNAFWDCGSLTNITIPDSVTSIGSFAFEYCRNLTSITIPNSVTSINQNAFNNCGSLTNITIPDSVTSIGDWAFSGCMSLTSITIPNSVTYIGSRAFYECTNLESITIPDSVTSIGGGAFEGCTSLPVVDNIRYADTCAAEAVDKTLSTYILKEDTRFVASTFYECRNLTSITIPNSVTYIGGGAFEDCSSLTSVTIPNSVTTIGGGAFEDCSSLISVTVEATTPPTLEYRYGSYSQFRNNASGRKIYVPAESVAAYKSASGWSAYASDIEAIA